MNRSLRIAAGAWLLLNTHLIYAEPAVDGERKVWHPLTITFAGPEASENDNHPNPFLDIRLQVAFAGPSGQRVVVPGFFDGDGKGGVKGTAWRVRFAPEAPGIWKYEASFRAGTRVAIELDENAGMPMELPNLSGSFTVAQRDPAAPGFLKWGRLAYANKHYLKFQDGPYWIRGGTDEPENFLAYAGFDRTPPKHKYADHIADWKEGDPDWGDGKGRAIIGVLNYLASQEVNSIYFLTMNVGGDGKDVWPWAGSINPKGSPSNDNVHYDVAKLQQWETVFTHAQKLGLFLHFVFNEAEEANKRELDNGELGPERKLYYREMIARFGHHVALQWNLCEEYNLDFDFGPERVCAFAEYVRTVDPYDHPITVHSAGDPVEELRFTYGDPRFDLTSIQLNQKPIHEVTEAIYEATAKAGRPLPVSLDEFTLDRGQRASHIPVDDAEGQRREKLWPTYLSGGMIEFILEDLLKTDSFKTPQRAKLWRYVAIARKFMEENLPFWEMEPADELSQGAATMPLGIGKGKKVPLGPQVFAKRGEVYAVYYPTTSSTGTLDLTELAVSAVQRWFNPRTGKFEGETKPVDGGGKLPVGPPPADPDEDWVLLITRSDKRPAATDTKQPSFGKATIPLTGFQDSASHWYKIRNQSRVIAAVPHQQTYDSSQIREIVGNILLFQRENGGWPKDYDMTAVLTEEQVAAVRGTRENSDTSFDNHNVHSQVDYLARAYTLFGEEKWREACVRGYDFLLAAQLPSGGFPQRFPNAKGYAAHITFNDGVMIGILNVLLDAAQETPHWKWLDATRQQKAKEAVERGVACILKCQIRVNGRGVGWCQQHDETTFEPTSARTFELASICPQDSTEIVRFLMRMKSPSEEVKATIRGTVAWLEDAKLTGLRAERVPTAAVEFANYRSEYDTVVVADPSARPIWARHYEIGTNRPIFAGRDAVKRYALKEIERERRSGTPWYGYWPENLLAVEYPRWNERRRVSEEK